MIRRDAIENEIERASSLEAVTGRIDIFLKTDSAHAAGLHGKFLERAKDRWCVGREGCRK
jgi:hypothetical protein